MTRPQTCLDDSSMSARRTVGRYKRHRQHAWSSANGARATGRQDSGRRASGSEGPSDEIDVSNIPQMPDGVERPGSLQTLKLGASELRIHDVRIVAPHPPADKHRALLPMRKADVTNSTPCYATESLSCAPGGRPRVPRSRVIDSELRCDARGWYVCTSS